MILKRYPSSKTREHLLYEANTLTELIFPDLVEIGHVNPYRIERIAEIYAKLGIGPANYSLKGFIFRPDTMRGISKGIVLFLIIALAVLAIIGGTLFLFNAKLKKSVNERTVDLRRVNDDLNNQIREREAAENELRSTNNLLNAIIEGTTDAIFIKDLRGRYVLANSATLSAMGKAWEDVIGRQDSEIFPPPSAETIADGDNKVWQTGQTVMMEERIQTAYGDTFWMTNKSPLRDEDGSTVGVIGISRNISERKRLEEERITLQEHLLQAQKMESLGTLAGGIAHDFNNILAAILGYTELLKEDIPPDGETGEYVNEIYNAAKRAKHLVVQILAFSRRHPEGTSELVDFAEIVDEALHLLRAAIPNSVEIEKEVEIRDKKIVANTTQLHQIVMNICTNAAQSMEENGGKMTVRVTEEYFTDLQPGKNDQPPQGNYLKLVVSDTGVGIPEEHLEKIFDPYFTTKAIGQGSGMGLSVVLGIVKSHGGFIRVNSTPGEGTTVLVYFPETEAEPSTVSKKEQPLPGGREKLLVVDDEKGVAVMTKEGLKRLGYEVTVVANSLLALESFRKHSEEFDLAIIDQTMPGMTGDKLLQEMLALRPEFPVILCTGHSSRMDKDKALELGARAYLTKPVGRKVLATTIRQVLDRECA